MHKALKIVWKTIVALAAILFMLWLLIQTPAVQTFLARKAVDKVEKMMNGKIGFSKIHLSPFNALVLKDVTILDNDPATTVGGERLDTILRAESVVATFTLKGLVKKEGIHIRKASIDNAILTLTSEERGSNLSRFIGDNFKSEKKDKKRDGNLFDIGTLNVKDFRFRMIDPEHEGESEGTMDFKDMDVNVSKVKAQGIKYSGGILTGKLQELIAKEKSGYSVENLKTDFRYSGQEASLKDLHFSDGMTRLDIPEVSINGLDSIKDAQIKARIDGSQVKTETLGYFIPSMQGKSLTASIEKASVNGTLDDISIDRFSFSEQASEIVGTLSGHITGLPDLRAASLDINADGFTFSTKGIETLIKNLSPNSKIDLSKYAQGEVIRFSGRGTGKLDNLKVDGDITSDIGQAAAHLGITNLISKGKPAEITGSFSTNELNAGKIAGIDKLGECTLHGAMSTILDKGETKIKIDSLLIDKFNALGYDYSNIMANGTYSDKAFDGRVICNDPNLNLIFQGIFTISDKTQNGLYKFYANLGYADLQALNIDKRGTSKVSGQINANYMTVEKSNLIGDIDVLGLVLENEEGRHDVGDICITSHTNNSIHRINLTSQFANGSYVGSKSATTFIRDLQDLTTRRELPVLYKDATTNWSGDEYGIKLNFHEASELLSFVKPGLYIADSTQVNLKITKEGKVNADITSPRLATGKNYLRYLTFKLDNERNSLNGAIGCKEASVSAFKFLENSASLLAQKNKVALNYSFDNRGEKNSNSKGDLHLSSELERAEDGKLLTHLKTLPSNIWYDGQGWDIPISRIELVGKDMTIDGLMARCGEQSLKVGGGFSTTTNDTLSVDLDKLDLDLINKLIRKDYGFAGTATGHALVTSPWKTNPGLMFNITCDSTSINSERIGTLKLGSALDDGRMHIVARNDLDGARSLDAIADYYTKTKTLDAKLMLDNLNGAYLQPIVRSVFSETAGRVSGTVTVKGKTDDLQIRSEGTRLDDVMLKIAYTNVPYWCNGTFSLTDTGLTFDDVVLRDRYHGTGRVYGGIIWDRFKKIRMDTRIAMHGCQAIDLNENQNPTFYGDLRTSGGVSITGPLSAILPDIDGRTDGGGNIHIPLDNASKDSKNELLTFKVDEKALRVDPYEVMISRLTARKKKPSDLSIRIKVNANNDTEAFVELDRSAGNVLAGHGQGTIDMDIRPNRHIFAINGDYTIEQGNFKFNAMDIAQRNFTISSGSNIRFNGDVMDSDLSISGKYSTKASIATLISDTTSVSTRRLVNCGVDISGKLREPILSFAIDVPDLDPTTKSKVESALNTDDKIQRQFLALLISGSFMPDEQSGIVNNSSMIYSNVAEIMAGQLNNILQKLDIPLDLGLNYQASESGTNIFDVALSTQLFNNRVLVNGAVGNRDYGRSGSQSDVAGDLDIEIKLDKSGQVRMNLFSHSADDYTNYLDNTQRSGVGIAYQREFNSVKELLRQLFIGRKKRDAQNHEIPPQPIEKEFNVVTINAEE